MAFPSQEGLSVVWVLVLQCTLKIIIPQTCVSRYMLLQRHVLHSYSLGGEVERPFMTYDVMVYDIHIVSNITDCPVKMVLLYHFEILVKDPKFARKLSTGSSI